MLPRSRSGALAAALVLGCGILGVVDAAPSSARPSVRQTAIPPGTKSETYVSGLTGAVSMAWVPGSERIFVTEQETGKIRIISRGRLLPRPCVNLDVAGGSNGGLLGISVHRFHKKHFLYAYFTNRSPLVNRVVRFKVVHNKCARRKLIVGNIAVGDVHQGGQLEFIGNRLFVSVGTAAAGRAQDVGSRLGKILRYRENGSIPPGNPFSEPGDRNPVWSYGHRNPFGLGHKPGTRLLFATDNGPTCDDELNHIRKGGNYGWGPGVACGANGVGPDPESPLIRWRRTIVPTDLFWYKGRMDALSGALYMGDWVSGRLHRFALNRRGSRVRNRRIILNSPGRIVDVSKGPHGWLYFLTRGEVFRIVPS